MTLDILICSLNKGIVRVQDVLLPPQNNVHYIVSYQYTDERYLDLIPAAIEQRADVDVYKYKGQGLSANRNLALEKSNADIVMFADDDAHILPETPEAVTRRFETFPDLDVAFFCASTYTGKPLKTYPEEEFNVIANPQDYSISALEMAFRREKIQGRIRFDERFGLGTKFLTCGEEEIWLEDALRLKLHMRYFPVKIVETSTMLKKSLVYVDAGVQRSRGAITYYLHGNRAWWICLKFAINGTRHGFCHFVPMMRHLAEGIRYMQRTSNNYHSPATAMTPLSIEFLICTIDERIANVEDMMPPPQAGVSYLVSWQRTSPQSQSIPLPAALEQRNDVRVVCTTSRGLSANRNNAFRHAEADILVIADDDCRYSPENIHRLRTAYAVHPQAKIILAQLTTSDGSSCKRYPSEVFDYRHIPKGYYPSSWEITMRKEAALIPFDTAFGIGAPRFGCGEEEVWVHDASHVFGPQCVVYVPFTLGTTSPATTGARFLADKSVQRAKGAVLRIIHGPFGATLRVIRTALAAPVTLPSRFLLLKEMLVGISTVRHRVSVIPHSI